MEIIYEPVQGESISALDTMYPTLTKYVTGSNERLINTDMTSSTTFGYVLDGSCIVQANGQEWSLVAGNYFAFHGDVSVQKSHLLSMWTTMRVGYRCMPVVGQIEGNGRLSYIDGCSDSVLVSMPRRGDPVLNYLHFPTGILQTQHTHPSIRMGVVISGEGEAFQEQGNYHEGWVKPLKKGCIFMLKEQELHSFRTTTSHMDIVAYHPDSDTGPTDETHAMINRTFIDHGQ